MIPKHGRVAYLSLAAVWSSINRWPWIRWNGWLDGDFVRKVPMARLGKARYLASMRCICRVDVGCAAAADDVRAWCVVRGAWQAAI